MDRDPVRFLFVSIRACRAGACEGWVIRGQNFSLAKLAKFLQTRRHLEHRGQGREPLPGGFLSPFSDLAVMRVKSTGKNKKER